MPDLQTEYELKIEKVENDHKVGKITFLQKLDKCSDAQKESFTKATLEEKINMIAEKLGLK